MQPWVANKSPKQTKTKEETMRHGIVCSLVIALLCACQPSAGATTPPTKLQTRVKARSNVVARVVPKPSQSLMTLRDLSKIVGATCENPDVGEGCSGGDYDVELLPDCNRDGLLAGVIAADGALLIDKAPPDDSVRRAVLSQGQLVCIQAVARAGASASYYYVVAVRRSDSPKCLATSECGQFDGRNVRWLISHGNRACVQIASGRFDGDCASGWIRESNLSIISDK